MSRLDLDAGFSSPVGENDEDEAEAREFLSNLSGVGALCTFEEVNKIKNPILAGKIVKIEPFKSNVEIDGPSVMVITLREVFSVGSKTPREFLVYFFEDAARLMMRSKLNVKDYVAIRKPILIRNPTYVRPPKRAFTVILIVGSLVGNRVEDVYGRLKRKEDWHKLLEINIESPRISGKRKRSISPSNDEPENEVQVIEPPEVTAIQLNDSDEEDIIQSTPDAPTGLCLFKRAEPEKHITLPNGEPEERNDAAIVEESIHGREPLDGAENDVTANTQDASTDLRTGTSTKSPEQPPNATPSTRSPEQPSNATPPTGSSEQPPNATPPTESSEKPPNVTPPTRGPEQSTNTISNEGVRTRATSLLPSQNMENIRLKDVKLRMNITVFGVITNHKDLRMDKRGKFIGRIEISDETRMNFPVEFYLTAWEVPIHLRQFDVIKLIDMEIQSYKNKLYGRITQTRNVVTYARENPAIKHNQTQSYEYTADDKLRVKRLIRWMQKNVPGAHMFTRLCDIKTNPDSLHLLATVVEMKFFKTRSLLLRLRDGTMTTQFFREHDFSKQTLHSSTKEIPVLGSDFVDILVLNTFPRFVKFVKNQVQVGSVIELNHVHAILKDFTYKGKSTSAIQLHFMANEKHIRIRETDSQLMSQVLSESVPNMTELENVDQSERQKDLEIPPKRRKLFNEEEQIMLIDGTISNTSDTMSVRAEENPETTNEIRYNPDEVQTETSNREIKEASICIPCKVAVPRLEDFSEVRTVPNSPEAAGRDENASPVRTDLDEAVMENLYRKVKAMVRDIRNSDDSNEAKFQCLEQWPHDTQDEFWIQVSLVSTLPVITSASTDADILSLVSVHCERCKKYTPFLFVSEWKMTDGGCAIKCSSCEADGKEVRLRYLMKANLLVKDSDGAVASALVVGRAAEKFFGCTLPELVMSKETQFRVKNLLLNSNTLTLKLKTLETTARGTRYIVLARQTVI